MEISIQSLKRRSVIVYKSISVLGLSIALPFVIAMIHRAGPLKVLKMAWFALTFQHENLLFENGTLVIVFVVLVVYGVISFFNKKRNLYVLDGAVILMGAFRIMGASQLKIMFPIVLAGWVLHRLVLGSIIFCDRGLFRFINREEQ